MFHVAMRWLSLLFEPPMMWGYEISEIEDVAEERFALTAVAGSVVVIVVTMAPNLMIPVAMLRRAARLIVTAAGRGRRGHGALDDLVELAAVKPDAAAFRTILDLNALAIRHHQIDGTSRILHARNSY